MKRALFVLACVCALSHADADPKTVKLSVPSVGEVSVVCADPGGWRVSAAAKTEAGADVVTVELAHDLGMRTDWPLSAGCWLLKNFRRIKTRTMPRQRRSSRFDASALPSSDESL